MAGQFIIYIYILYKSNCYASQYACHGIRYVRWPPVKETCPVWIDWFLLLNIIYKSRSIPSLNGVQYDHIPASLLCIVVTGHVWVCCSCQSVLSVPIASQWFTSFKGVVSMAALPHVTTSSTTRHRHISTLQHTNWLVSVWPSSCSTLWALPLPPALDQAWQGAEEVCAWVCVCVCGVCVCVCVCVCEGQFECDAQTMTTHLRKIQI